MKIIIVIIIWLALPISVMAQKPPVDFKAIDNWSYLSDSRISNDGNYMLYVIKGNDDANDINGDTYKRCLIIRSTGKTFWKKMLPNVDNGVFSADSKFLVYKSPGDTLFLQALGAEDQFYIANVSAFQLTINNKLVYFKKDTPGKLIIRDLKDGKEQSFDHVNNYLLSHDEKHLLLLATGDSAKVDRLLLTDLANGKPRVIWEGKNAQNLVFSNDDQQIAFTTKSEKVRGDELWQYHNDDAHAEVIASQKIAGIDTSLSVNADYEPFFNYNGSRVFFQLKQAYPPRTKKTDPDKPIVWNYKDVFFPKNMDNLLGDAKTVFLAEFNENSPKSIIQLEKGDRSVISYYNTDIERSADIHHLGNYDQPYILEEGKGANSYEYNDRFNKPFPDLYRVSMDDGSEYAVRIRLKYSIRSLQQDMHFSQSPTGRWLLYYDQAKAIWYSYNVLTGENKNITGAIKTSIRNDEFTEGAWLKSYAPAGVAAWLDHDSGVLINDNNDIWKVDPSGITPPLNITNGYGVAHHMRFRILQTMQGKLTVSDTSTLLLTAFNTETKYNGFYDKKLNQAGQPDLLTMGPYNYCTIFGQTYSSSVRYSYQPQKAKSAKAWLIGRATTAEAPNIFFTRDFKTLNSMSNIQPQKNYNWMSAQLVHWQIPNEHTSQGILYKPENFDPNKKYPLIFTFYQRHSDGMYNFQQPDYTPGSINIAYYVSQGYVVFQPDIYFKTGLAYGPSINNAIVSAANYLMKTYPWIDSKHLGLSGESFSGYAVNYLITHTNQFAAAQECCGMSDLVNAYNNMTLRGWDQKNFFYNTGYYKMNGSLWKNQQAYIQNSPIFSVDKVTTPLFILHNDLDKGVNFSQGIELFSALWELRKPVWMLEYPKGGHGVSGKSEIDFDVRLMQFFDHYLKGAPAPKWMTEGYLERKENEAEDLQPETDPNKKP